MQPSIKTNPKPLVRAAWGMGNTRPLTEYAFGALPSRLVDHAHPHSHHIGAPRGQFYAYPTGEVGAMGRPITGMGFPLIEANGREVNFLRMGTAWALEDRLFTGRPVAGCYVELGRPTPKVLVTVDPIDAMALNAATSLRTIAVLYAENIADVCRELKLRFPDIEIQLCLVGDGGTEAEYSPALRLLRGVSKRIVASASLSGGSSFSKIYATSGSSAVRAVLAVRHTKSAWGADQDLKKARIPVPAMPWSHPVNGSGLMEGLLAALHKHVDLPENDARLIALWIVHTYTISASRFNPLLVIVSPDFGCGKSSLFALLKRLCFKALWTSKISPAKVAQAVRKLNPTLLMDEAQTLVKNASFITDLIASHDRASGSIFAGHKDELSVVDVFGPKALALKGELPEALVERSVLISLQRMVQSEEAKPAVPLPGKEGTRLNDDLMALSAQLRRWADDHLTELSAPRPARLSLGSPRVSDTFWPLLAIASAMGDDVAIRAEEAARESVASNAVESPGVLLLAHLMEVVAALTGGFLKTSDLLSALNAEGKEDWGWTTYNRGKPLDALYLSKLLRPYNVVPGKSGGGTDRGYRRADLEDAIRRYVRVVGEQTVQ
jgi:hypothetical protein